MRKQMRHSPNLRMYPLGRPHRLQRDRACTGKRGARRLAMIFDFFANSASFASA